MIDLLSEILINLTLSLILMNTNFPLITESIHLLILIILESVENRILSVFSFYVHSFFFTLMDSFSSTIPYLTIALYFESSFHPNYILNQQLQLNEQIPAYYDKSFYFLYAM